MAFAGLVAALAELSVTVDVFTQLCEKGQVEVRLDSSVQVFRSAVGRPRSFGPSVALKRAIQRAGQTADVMHTFGLWRAVNRYSCEAARTWRRPHMISSTGMLEPEALRRRSLPKKVSWTMWQRRALETAACVHATGPREVQSIREAGLSSVPVALIPNGVESPDLDQVLPRHELSSLFPGLGEGPYALYLGRIHPFKGVLDLVKAMEVLGTHHAPQKVVFAGPDWQGYSQIVFEEARKRGVQSSLLFVGEVEGPPKWSLLRHADALALPSSSENFGISVAEALACGTPAIANTGAPWQCLVESGCGWWVEPGPEPLAEALLAAFELSLHSRRAMGRRGRALVAERFAWPRIGRMFLSTYKWLAGRGPQPEHVSSPE